MLDAFSSDAVPVHLLTVESLATSMRTVAPGGVIAVHISNRFLDLEPIVAAAAHANGLVSIIGSDLPPEELTDLADPSQWVIVARSYADLADLVEGDRWRTARGRRPWTDRYSDLIRRDPRPTTRRHPPDRRNVSARGRWCVGIPHAFTTNRR